VISRMSMYFLSSPFRKTAEEKFFEKYEARMQQQAMDKTQHSPYTFSSRRRKVGTNGGI
jgi:hypothetical protein